MPETNPTPEASAEPTPLEFLASLHNAPTPDQIAALKSEVPNGAIRGFSPDGKRCFLLRGMTGIEMREIQKSIPEQASDSERDFKIAAVCACCVWTNTSRTGKLDPTALRASTAGLPETLFLNIEILSDYFAPAQILNMSFDL